MLFLLLTIIAAPPPRLEFAAASAIDWFAVKSRILELTSTISAFTVAPLNIDDASFISSFHIAEPENSRCALSITEPTLSVALFKNFLLSQS